MSPDGKVISCPISDNFKVRAEAFKESDRRMIKDMCICAYCGKTEFGGRQGQNKNFITELAAIVEDDEDLFIGYDEDGAIPPYAICNAFVRDHCATSDKKSW